MRVRELMTTEVRTCAPDTNLGVAAALMLGAVGVNLGTRFLASKEATIEEEWKRAIVAANSEDAVKIDFLNDIRPLPGTGGYGTVLRSLRTPFVSVSCGLQL